MQTPLGSLLAVVLMAVPLQAAPAPSQLTVDDNAKVFSESAIGKAKETLTDLKSKIQVHIETSAKLTPYETAKFEEDKKAFWRDWIKAQKTGDRGLVIGINMKPGHIEVLADKQVRDHGFATKEEGYVEKILAKAFGKAQDTKVEEDALKIRDDALIEVAEYLRKNLPEGPAGKDKSK